MFHSSGSTGGPAGSLLLSVCWGQWWKALCGPPASVRRRMGVFRPIELGVCLLSCSSNHLMLVSLPFDLYWICRMGTMPSWGTFWHWVGNQKPWHMSSSLLQDRSSKDPRLLQLLTLIGRLEDLRPELLSVTG
jgi:hypothetical protein